MKTKEIVKHYIDNGVFPLSKRQAEIYRFIEDYNKEHGKLPIYRIIAENMKIKIPTVAQHVEAMINKGHLLKVEPQAAYKLL